MEGKPPTRKIRGADITGMRSGRLVALEPTEFKKRNATLWRCRCDCGREILTEAYRIRNQYTQSCGCMRTEKRIKDITGNRYGNLLAIERLDRKKGASYLWRCECDCGKIVEVSENSLTSGNTKSCGCARVRALKQTLEKHGNIKNHSRLIDGTSVDLIERKKIRKNNTSGYTGVQARGNRWIAVITFKKKVYYLGIYDRIEEAVQARKKAEDRLFGEFLDWYYSEYRKGK